MFSGIVSTVTATPIILNRNIYSDFEIISQFKLQQPRIRDAYMYSSHQLTSLHKFPGFSRPALFPV